MSSPAACPINHHFDPLADDYLRAPYPFLNEVREEGPVCYVPSIGYWVVTRFEDIDAILMDPATFSASVAQAPLMPLHDEAAEILHNGLTNTPVLSNFDPPGHTRTRRRIAKALSPRRVNMLRPTIEERANNLIEAFADEGRVDLVKQLTFPLPALTIFTMLGFPDEDAEMLKEWCADKLEVNWGRPSAQYQLRAATNMTKFWRYCVDFVERRKELPQDDLTSDMLTQRETDPDALDDRELASVLFALSFAGHETTTNLTSNAVRQLLTHREAWEEICADPSLIDGAVEETLRYDTSVIAWRRVTTKDTVIGGVSVPSGAKLMLAFGAANHDPREFERPDTFDIHRPNSRRQLSFGRGIHLCLGATLARVETGTMLRSLSERIPGLRLTRDQEFIFPPNISFRGPERLLVEWEVD